MIRPVGEEPVHPVGEPAPASSPPISDLSNALRRLRASAKAQLVLQRLGLIVAMLLGAAVVVGLLDYWLRLPMALRLVFWVGLVAPALWTAYRRVVPALSFTPTLTEVALRVEHSPAGRKAGLEGVLASGLELASARRDQSDLSDALRAGAVAQAARRFGTLPRWTNFLDSRELSKTLLALCAVGVPVLALSLAAPLYARVGWARVATPWASVSWPKRTAIVAVSQPIAHAIDAPLPLRAVLTRAPAGQAPDIAAEYRVVVDGQAGPWRRALLTSQQRAITVEMPGGAPPASGTLYERLLDTTSLVGASRGSTVALEYAFHTDDDSTEMWRTLLIEPPALVGATAEVTPPEYAHALIGAASPFASGTRDLGPGRDERAALGPILAGSRVTLTITLNKTLPSPSAEGLTAWAAATMPGLESQASLHATFTDRAWVVTFEPGESFRLPVVLTDSFGIHASDEAAFRFEVVADRPAAAAMIDPIADEAVLATAVVPVTAEGRDDVALAWTALTSQVAKIPANSAGAAPEATDPPAEVVRTLPTQADAATRLSLRAGSVIDLGTRSLAAGDEVWLRATSMDVLAASSGAAASESAIRRLRIIGESEFIEQVRAELTGVREAAKRLAGDQARLGQRLSAAAEDADAATPQAAAQQSLGQRLTPMGDVLRRLAQRVERNNLADRAMSGLLEDAAMHVDTAGSQSDNAAKELDALTQTAASPEARAAAAKGAGEAQAAVEEELSALANLLDRGQDSWALRRELEKLLTEQRQLRAQTQAAGEGTRGLAAENLTQAQREDMERLARRQQDAARRSDALVESLQQRANALRAGDPAQADAMQAAAARAQREQLGDAQRRAGEQIQKNQTAQATQLQEQAEQAIENVLEELDKAESKQEEALRRLLADLAESIEMLVATQDRELKRLAEAVAGVVPSDLDAGMIALNQNTLSVRDKAEEGARGAAKLLALLGAAAEAQGEGVASLRATDFAVAETHERTSLQKLTDALGEARKLEDDAQERDAAEKRAELRKVYTESLEAQAGILAETKPLLGEELTRKQRSEARAIGDQQLLLREQLSQMRSQTQDIADAVLFSFAHDRLDEAMASAAAPLREGQSPAIVGFHQNSALRTLQALVKALAEEPKDSDFREEEGSGDGGGGGGGGQAPPLVPPIAELKLLRALQAEAGELTRALSDAGTAADAAQLRAASKLQREIAKRAQQLLERLNEENTPPDGGPEVLPEPGVTPEEPDGGATP